MALALSVAMSDTAARDFGAFYEEWFGRVYNYARHRTGSAVRADEIVADVFARVWAGWRRYDPAKADRRTWLFAIAFRAVADHYRGESRRRWLSLGLIPRPPEGDLGPPAAAEEEERRRSLFAALSRLGAQAREIVSLRFYGGLSNRAIAGLLGLTESNVAVILFRSVRRMREELEGGEPGHG